MAKSNELLEENIKQLDLKIDEKHNDLKETLIRIETQTTKTNGRVTSLEKWMWMIVGGLTILGWLVAQKLLTISNIL